MNFSLSQVIPLMANFYPEEGGSSYTSSPLSSKRRLNNELCICKMKTKQEGKKEHEISNKERVTPYS